MGRAAKSPGSSIPAGELILELLLLNPFFVEEEIGPWNSKGLDY